MAESGEEDFFREAWNLRTVQKVTWVLAKRSTCRQASPGFAALPEALKKVVWDCGEDEAGSRELWAAAWRQHIAAAPVLAPPMLLPRPESGGGGDDHPPPVADAAPLPGCDALQEQLRVAETAEQRLRSQLEEARRAALQAADELRSKEEQLQSVNRKLESEQGEWRQERDQRDEDLRELREQLANAHDTARQQPPVMEAGSENQEGAVKRISAGTVTVFTKFDAHAAGSVRGERGRGLGSICGLLSSKPGDHRGVFELYNRLFKGATVGECLVKRTTGVFLKESEFMDQYRSPTWQLSTPVFGCGTVATTSS